MDELVCAMTKTAQGIIYDCKHIRTIMKVNGNDTRREALMHILTRHQRLPYVLLWVILTGVIVLMLVLVPLLVTMTRRMRTYPQRYYFEGV